MENPLYFSLPWFLSLSFSFSLSSSSSSSSSLLLALFLCLCLCPLTQIHQIYRLIPAQKTVNMSQLQLFIERSPGLLGMFTRAQELIHGVMEARANDFQLIARNMEYNRRFDFTRKTSPKRHLSV